MNATMARVEIFTTPVCPFCVRAKRLLGERRVPYDERDVGADARLRDEMVSRGGRRTFPQIFIDGRSIGGFEELAALDAQGQLTELALR